MTSHRISVVLPVYNEHVNIQTCLRGLGAALDGHEHEILVCYDFDEDTTLPAIAAMPDAPRTIRLVKNEYGRGAANALRSGFRAATGDVIVTTMADLSDPPELIPALAEKIRREDAAVVSGSRYVRGGSQTGGPLFKRFCSQTASLTLKWFTGLSTHDATSNFRAYSRAFLDEVRVESEQGFEIALELTVKAHLAGRRVAEVPSSWMDRTGGESRFRIWRWMPNYLRWYWEAMAAPAFVWIVFFAMLVAAHAYVAMYSSVIPFWDDLEWVPFMSKSSYLTADWWWSLHNEHRIPLPRAVVLPLLRMTGDVRSGMYLEVYLLAAIALAMILLARKLRGRTSYTDALFPILWLTWGNAENLLMMHQVSLILPTAITSTILMLVATRPELPGWRRSLALGVCTFSLPLCGGPGITPTPAILAWLAYAGWLGRRSADRSERRSGAILLGSVALTVALIAFYFYDFQNPQKAVYAHSAVEALRQAMMFLSLSFGPAAREYWPLSGWITAAFAVGTLVTLALVIRSRPRERLRAAGVMAVGGGIVSMAVCTGIARAGASDFAGFAGRYVTLPSPLLCCVYFAFCLYSPAAIGRFVRVSLYSLLLLLVFYDIQVGRTYGEKRARDSEAFLADLSSGMTLKQLAARHWANFFNGPEDFQFRLGYLQTFGIGPVANVRVDDSEAPCLMFKTQPFLVLGARVNRDHKVAGQAVLLVQPPSEVHFTLKPGMSLATGRFGIHPLATQRFEVTNMRFSIEVVENEQPLQTLWTRTLQPDRRPEEADFQSFSVPIPAGAQGELVLRVSGFDRRFGEHAWCYWTDVELR